MSIISYQPELRPALPSVFACKDYHEFRDRLELMHDILLLSGCEEAFIFQHLKKHDDDLSLAQIHAQYRTTRTALRYSLLIGVTGLAYRELALRVADSHLFQWFTYTAPADEMKPVSKSTIERYEKMFEVEQIDELTTKLNLAVTDQLTIQQLLYQNTVLKFDAIFADTTCIKVNMHFPVDWVLLRDGSSTLIKAINLIREKGLKHRISDPDKLMKQMNKLCIQMTHARRKRDARKARKLILRRMKALTKTIKRHAENYYQLLEQRWTETDWSELEKQVVLDRMKGILDQLPDALNQAHERIIGERRVANKDKILSLYEADVHVIVRGKSGAETEFGNGLYLAEQQNGLIVDYDYMKDQPTPDSKLVEPSLSRINQHYGMPKEYVADRGFDSPSVRDLMDEHEIFNAVCPRSVPQLQSRLQEEEFSQLQERRGSTEARIAIFKNAYLGAPLKNKGYAHRRIRIAWCVLTHNLWKLADIAAQNRAKQETALAATG